MGRSFLGLSQKTSRVDPWNNRWANLSLALHHSEFAHTLRRPRRVPKRAKTYPNNEYKCFIRVDGRCNHNVRLRKWFDDASMGGPKATSERACEIRKNSWKGFCGENDVSHKFVFPNSKTFDASKGLDGGFQSGMEVAIWNPTHKRFLQLYGSRVHASGQSNSPFLPAIRRGIDSPSSSQRAAETLHSTTESTEGTSGCQSEEKHLILRMQPTSTRTSPTGGGGRDSSLKKNQTVTAMELCGA